jgi:hypothetical protein
MTKIVYAKLKSGKRLKSAAVKIKRLKGTDGKIVTLHVVSAESRTLGDDLNYVFGKNVRKARKANRARASVAVAKD